MTDLLEMKVNQSFCRMLEEFNGDPSAIFVATPLKPWLIATHFLLHQVHKRQLVLDTADNGGIEIEFWWFL